MSGVKSSEGPESNENVSTQVKNRGDQSAELSKLTEKCNDNVEAGLLHDDRVKDVLKNIGENDTSSVNDMDSSDEMDALRLSPDTVEDNENEFSVVNSPLGVLHKHGEEIDGHIPNMSVINHMTSETMDTVEPLSKTLGVDEDLVVSDKSDNHNVTVDNKEISSKAVPKTAEELDRNTEMCLKSIENKDKIIEAPVVPSVELKAEENEMEIDSCENVTEVPDDSNIHRSVENIDQTDKIDDIDMKTALIEYENVSDIKTTPKLFEEYKPAENIVEILSNKVEISEKVNVQNEINSTKENFAIGTTKAVPEEKCKITEEDNVANNTFSKLLDNKKGFNEIGIHKTIVKESSSELNVEKIVSSCKAEEQYKGEKTNILVKGLIQETTVSKIPDNFEVNFNINEKTKDKVISCETENGRDVDEHIKNVIDSEVNIIKLESNNHDTQNIIKDNMNINSISSIDTTEDKCITDKIDKNVGSPKDNNKETNDNITSTAITENKKEKDEKDEPKPSTSKEAMVAVPSTSYAMEPDASDEIPDVSDNLGLLAESSRSLDYEDQDDDDGDADGDGDGDDEEYDYQDDESNQMTADHSEDSNNQQSETDQPKEPAQQTNEESKFDSDPNNDPDNATDTFMEMEKENNFDFTIASVDHVDSDKVEEVDNVTVEEIKDDSDEAVNESATPLGSEAITEQVTESITVDKDEKKTSSAPESMDVETVKLSDTESETNSDSDNNKKESTRQPTDLLRNILSKKESQTLEKVTPKNYQKNVIVDLGGSSSDEENQDEKSSKDDKKKPVTKPVKADEPRKDLAETKPSEHISKDINKTDSALCTNVTSTSEVTKKDLEIFNLDSDDEGDNIEQSPLENPVMSNVDDKQIKKCVNYMCPNLNEKVTFHPAPMFTLSYFDVKVKKRTSYYICELCLENVSDRMQNLIKGVREFKPLMLMDTDKQTEELVEISDSDSDSDDGDVIRRPEQILTEDDLVYLEDMQIGDMINDIWMKYNLDEQIVTTQSVLDDAIKQVELDTAEIDTSLTETQAIIDRLRLDLYATFKPKDTKSTEIHIIDPEFTPTLPAFNPENVDTTDTESRRSKRLSKETTKEISPSSTQTTQEPDKVDDDNAEITVVKLSAEAAPPELPPPGELIRPPPLCGDQVYIMRQLNNSWSRARILELMPYKNGPFSEYKVRFENQAMEKSVRQKTYAANTIAYSTPAPVRLTIGTRVIALFKEETNQYRKCFFSGIIAEIPNPVNNYRYLVFFDDGYAQYVKHDCVRVVIENSLRVWDDVHPDSKEFVKNYLMDYPERPMVRLHAGQNLKAEWNGKWWACRVLAVDASLAHVRFEADARAEWVYRGSTRLLPLFLELRPRARAASRLIARPKDDMPYVEYTRSDEQENKQAPDVKITEESEQEARKLRAVAKKSTGGVSTPQSVAPQQNISDSVLSRVVYYTPKAAVKPLKMVPHNCSIKCRRYDVLPLKELRTYNPLARPLLSGWERQIVRYKGRKEIMYRAPCGRRLRNMPELHRYLRITQSDMGVDLFHFNPTIHCLSEFVLNRCIVSKKDLSHGRENVPVPCVNYYDSSLPEFCSYNTERTPTAGVPLNLDPDFLCGCDCLDDCQDKTKCDCWKLTLEGAKTIGLEGDNLGYEYKRLPEPLPSGIFECNSRCKCKSTCLNRVAQHPLQLKLQVFKTENRGWGIRSLNDVPKGAFLCVYAGNLLTDATANLDGINEGDEYQAELDYIEVVEQMKEGYEDEVRENEERSNKTDSESKSDAEEDDYVESEDENDEKNYEDDDEFKLTIPTSAVSEFKKTLRKRSKKGTEGPPEKKKQNVETSEKEKGNEDCITISDDEEAREPSRFTAQPGMDDKEYKSKYRSVRSYFGEDEACYIMDAKVQGNIGRYLNHSCAPNVFVQNVFVDTHDPRFPWVAFFALADIRAGAELTWNYNYDVGSVPGKLMYCRCSAPNCRGRLL